MKTKKEIIVGVSAGISAYKACELVRVLVKKEYGVTVLMSPDAVNFVGPLTFATLTSRPVITDMFSNDIQWDPCHIALAEKADLVVVVPATAHIIGKLACGLCDDIITCVIMATKAQVVICPAMNDNMYNHAAFQSNLSAVKKMGYSIVGPIEGELACGRQGIGHVAEIETIINKIEKLLK